jgi:WD40 repeat protein
VAEGKEVRRLEGHDSFVEAIVLAPDGKRLYSCSGSVLEGAERAPSKDHSIIVWDLATGNQVFRLIGHQRQVKSLALSPDGKTLASCSEDGMVRLWKTPN